jgi:uncharacterized protein YukE
VTKDIAVGSEEFKVDLEEFSNAVGSVSKDRDAIADDFKNLKTQFEDAKAAWDSPAGSAFAELENWLTSAIQQANDALDAMVTRMGVTLANYQGMESANANNLT